MCKCNVRVRCVCVRARAHVCVCVCVCVAFCLRRVCMRKREHRGRGPGKARNLTQSHRIFGGGGGCLRTGRRQKLSAGRGRSLVLKKGTHSKVHDSFVPLHCKGTHLLKAQKPHLFTHTLVKLMFLLVTKVTLSPTAALRSSSAVETTAKRSRPEKWSSSV